MHGSINISEIFIVDGAGIFCLLFLISVRHSFGKSGRRMGERLFNSMIGINI